MKKELKYRTFDELLDSVKIDLPGIDVENQIEAQQLIKRALFINKQLGVKVNPWNFECIYWYSKARS